MRDSVLSSIIRVFRFWLAVSLVAAIFVVGFGFSGLSYAEAASTTKEFTRFFVYFPLVLKTGAYVIPVEYFVPYTTSPARKAMEALLAGLPSTDGLFVVPLPKETRIRNIFIKDGVCTVDFSQDIQRVSVGAMGEAAILNSITWTLCQFKAVKSVRILIEGQKCESLAGHVDITEPLKPDETRENLFFTFEDAITHWGGGAISILQAMDIVDGYPDKRFLPDQELKRAEFLKMLVETLRLPYAVEEGSDGAGFFKDTINHWSKPYVERALKAGIISREDYGENLNPDGVIPREEVAFLLEKASNVYMAQHPEIEFKKDVAPVSFGDSSLIQAKYKKAVEECVKRGFINGYPDGTFQPKSALKRAEACAVLTRMLAIQGKKVLLVSPRPGFKWDGSKVFALGCAAAFEGTVNFRIKEAGSTSMENYTTSTYGMGWGFFGLYVDGSLLSGEKGLALQVYLVSMKDGSEESMVEVP